MILGCGGRYVSDTRYRAKPLGDRMAAAHLGVCMCYVYFLAPNYVLYFPPLTVVQIFTPLSLPNKKKGRKNDPVYYWGRTTSPQIPQFFRRGIRIPPCGHTKSIVEIRQWLYFQNNTGV
jgi:hypothetical protein